MLQLAAIVALVKIALPHGMDTTAEVLHAVRIAAGGVAWARVGAICAAGRKISFGLSGRYREIDDVKTGRFRRTADYGIFSNAEGTDAAGRWRLDGSGAVHDLDSAEAHALATTETFISRRGYLDEDVVTRARLSHIMRASAQYAYVEVTPVGGRSATLRVRRSDARVDRITIALSPNVEEIRYSDYRRVSGLLLPFRIVLDHGDEAESGAVTISSYRILGQISSRELERPSLSDGVTFVDGTASATVRARVDPASGFLLVDAALNGTAPVPFILDTGGHDIITPREAQELKLKPLGAGKSYGAGADATKTQFTTVRTVELGTARLGRQPFTVLALDLGQTIDANGRDVPIAGILGLEVFERFVVTLGKHQLTFAGNAGRDVPCRSIPLRFTNDMPLATASVNGIGGVFGIDTGNNSDPIVFAHFLHTNAIRVTTENSTRLSSVGGELALKPARIAELRLGPAVFNNLAVEVSAMKTGSLSTASEAGNIGMSLLARLPRVSFDYHQHRMCVDARW